MEHARRIRLVDRDSGRAGMTTPLRLAAGLVILLIATAAILAYHNVPAIRDTVNDPNCLDCPTGGTHVSTR